MSEVTKQPVLLVDEAIALLQGTPQLLQSLLEHLPTAWLDFREGPDAWSARTVLVHFIQNERTNWIPRATVVLSTSIERKFTAFQQLPGLGEIDDTDIPGMLAEFSRLRSENLAALRGFNLKPEDYRRTAEHPSLGIVTLGQLLATWVVHDLNHIHQIVKSLAKQQVQAVGPWRQYLSILDL